MPNFMQKKRMDLHLEGMSNCVNIKKKEFKKGEYILSFGLRQKTIGYIKEGKADIIKIDIEGNETILKKLFAGNIFNDAFSNYSSDSVFVISRTNTEIYFIDYIQIFMHCPIKCTYHQQIVQWILEMITENCIELNKKIEILSSQKIRNRILTFLTLEFKETGNNIYHPPFSLKEWASILGVDRSALMRELKKMENEKIISRKQKAITLLNVSHD